MVSILRPTCIALVLATTGAGLGAKVEDSATCPGQCDTHVHYRLDPRFTAAEEDVIAEAAAVWERGSGGRACFERRESIDADLEFIRLDDQAELKPEDPDWQHHVALCKGNRIWIVPSKVEERGEYVALVIHELGHHLGLPHIEDVRDTYMHSTINDTPRPMWDHIEMPERDRREYCAVRGCVCK